MATFFESIIIKKLDNSGTVTLEDVTCPSPFPRPTSQYSTKIKRMRDGGGSGFAIAQIGGASISGARVSLSCAYLTDTQDTGIDAIYKADPPIAFKLSIDSGVSYYRCVFDDGESYKPAPWPEQFDRLSAEIKIVILGVI